MAPAARERRPPVGTRGSAKPAPMTPGPADVCATFSCPAGCTGGPDHEGFSRWGPAQRPAVPRAVRCRLPSRGPQRCEPCLPLQGTDHAERWDSRQEGTTSELGVLPAARLRRAVPTGGRRSRAAVTTLHLRRSASTPFHARRGVQSDRSWGLLPVGAAPSHALSAGRLAPTGRTAGLGAHPGSTTGW